METMRKVRARIIQTLGIFIICLFMLMTIVGTYRIVTRYFFNKPSIVSEEFLIYNSTWMVLPALAYMFDRRDHVRIGFPADRISDSVKEYSEVAISLPTFAFAGVIMAYGGISIAKLIMIQTTASLRAPMGYTHAVVPMTGIIVMMFNPMSAADMLHTDFSKEKDAGV